MKYLVSKDALDHILTIKDIFQSAIDDNDMYSGVTWDGETNMYHINPVGNYFDPKEFTLSLYSKDINKKLKHASMNQDIRACEEFYREECDILRKIGYVVKCHTISSYNGYHLRITISTK